MKTTNLLLKKVIPAILFFALLLSCEETTEVIEKKNYIEFVTEDMKKIPNVTIKNGDIVLGKSDKEGNFKIDQTTLKENSTLVFEHKDYIKRYAVVNKNTLGAVLMKPRAKAIRINSKEGKKITTKSKVLIEIPQNAFSQNGKPYNGEVDITISSIDANNSFDVRTAPAPFIAQDELTGDLIPLTSYGIVEVLATTPKGTPLDLTKGTSIGISIPVTIEDTPEKVNLYALNPETGYWNLSGVLSNSGSSLIGEITTVNSSWNADEPCSTGLVCVKVKIVYASITSGCYGSDVLAKGLTYQGADGYYHPDASGYVYFWVCPDSVFELLNCLCSCPGGGHTNTKIIDLSTVTMNPSGCTDLGTWVIP